ncbi:aminotransferase class I and II [Crossiella sp. CA-258035]|uniref:HipA family kinase n=1 Tax=Crossiella sp. CA-258035 TaxID=2981138 RepID=UPI0024BD02CE|nr:HipA family kinase [Crossiella sp. CA-258035]WHT18532.1 aminotransferase class I and II [Crossiella sp. CA-258035]
MLRHVTATRYVTPLREGGSLPGLMEADDLGTYVVKFRGAGQGRKTLVAEVVVGELARALGLPVPELVTAQVDKAMAPSEPDEEVQELLRASHGLNLGMDFLPGALDFDPGAFTAEPEFAGRVLWFDALTGNVDRSWRNPNMLYWHGEPQLIDHGATLIFHHNWPGARDWAGRPYNAADHLLIGFGPEVAAADAALAPLVTEELLTEVLAKVPDDWLEDEPGFLSTGIVREAYVAALTGRIAAREAWLPGLVEAALNRGNDRVVPERGRNRPEWLKHLPGDAT